MSWNCNWFHFLHWPPLYLCDFQISPILPVPGQPRIPHLCRIINFVSGSQSFRLLHFPEFFADEHLIVFSPIGHSNPAMMREAEIHFDHAKVLDPENTVAQAFLDKVGKHSIVLTTSLILPRR